MWAGATLSLPSSKPQCGQRGEGESEKDFVMQGILSGNMQENCVHNPCCLGG